MIFAPGLVIAPGIYLSDPAATHTCARCVCAGARAGGGGATCQARYLIPGNDVAELVQLGRRQFDIQRCHILFQVLHLSSPCMGGMELCLSSGRQSARRLPCRPDVPAQQSMVYEFSYRTSVENDDFKALLAFQQSMHVENDSMPHAGDVTDGGRCQLVTSTLAS